MILLYINKGLVVKTSIIAFFSDYKMIAFNFISAIDNSFFEFISKKKKVYKLFQTGVCVCVCVCVRVWRDSGRERCQRSNYFQSKELFRKCFEQQRYLTCLTALVSFVVKLN